MTNPISKAIVKAAVAMGYGKKSDYKGSSVADVLEKFASIAKDKGSSGDSGEPFVITGTFDESSTSQGTVDKTTPEIEEALENNREVVFVLEADGAALTSKLAFKSVSSGITTYSFPYWEGSPAQIVVQNGAFQLLLFT